MDFIIGLPKLKGFDVVLVVVDKLRIYGLFIIIKQAYFEEMISEDFVKEIIHLWGTFGKDYLGYKVQL